VLPSAGKDSELLLAIQFTVAVGLFVIYMPVSVAIAFDSLLLVPVVGLEFALLFSLVVRQALRLFRNVVALSRLLRVGLYA
jgi:hypothetical protein